MSPKTVTVTDAVHDYLLRVGVREHAVLQRLRPGGLVAVDNVLWSGCVADPKNQEPNTRAIRAFNEKLRNDTRVDIAMVTVADGIFLARKK